MSSNHETADMSKTLHPVQWLMTIAIIAFCLTGTAAFMGWLPSSDAALKNETLATPEPTDKAATAPATGAILSPSDVSPVPVTSSDKTPAAVTPPPAPEVVPPKPAKAPTPVIASSPPPEPDVQPVARYCPDCGVVTDVQTVTRRGTGSGLGAVAGGVIGGLLGNQVGKGSGKDLATIAGAVVGGVAGHNVERNMTPTTRYRITVQMNDGSLRTIDQDQPPVWRPGDNVRVEGGQVLDSARASF